jgi:hypothetical protein
MIKLRIFDIPEEHAKQDFYEVVQVSKSSTLKDLKEKLIHLRGQVSQNMHLWKVPEPTHLRKYYMEIEREFKKFKTIRLAGQLIE